MPFVNFGTINTSFCTFYFNEKDNFKKATEKEMDVGRTKSHEKMSFSDLKGKFVVSGKLKLNEWSSEF